MIGDLGELQTGTTGGWQVMLPTKDPWATAKRNAVSFHALFSDQTAELWSCTRYCFYVQYLQEFVCHRIHPDFASSIAHQPCTRRPGCGASGPGSDHECTGGSRRTVEKSVGAR